MDGMLDLGPASRVFHRFEVELRIVENEHAMGPWPSVGMGLQVVPCDADPGRRWPERYARAADKDFGAAGPVSWGASRADDQWIVSTEGVRVATPEVSFAGCTLALGRDRVPGLGRRWMGRRSSGQSPTEW